jgi:hypothetical protein
MAAAAPAPRRRTAIVFAAGRKYHRIFNVLK